MKLIGINPREVTEGVNVNIFSVGTAGTYTVTIPQDGLYEIICVGGGGGGAQTGNGSSYNTGAGGSGGYSNELVQLTAGDYEAIVGVGGAVSRASWSTNTFGGQGGTSSFAGVEATGGEGGRAGGQGTYGGNGGTGTTANGNKGTNGGGKNVSYAGGASVYNGYGKGGNGYSGNASTMAYSTAGTAGYVSITLKQVTVTVYDMVAPRYPFTEEKSYPNVSIVGSLINTNCVLSGFSANNYAELPEIFDGSTPWERVLKFTTGNFTANQVVWGNNGDYRGFQVYIRTDGKFTMSGSSNNSTWNLFDVTSTTALTANTTYYLRVIYDGSKYTQEISTDGVNYNLEGTANVTTPVTITTIRLGTHGGAPFSGTIDLNESYININDERWWNGVETREISGYKYYAWGNVNQVLFDSSTPGTYTLELSKGNYDITCVGGGGAAALRGVYDDRGYGWGGGSGSAFKGVFSVPEGTYTIVIGSANNNTTPQTSNSQTSNPTDTSTHDSYIEGILRCAGGGSGNSSLGVGQGGTAPVLYIVPITESTNLRGNNGAYNSGGKGSASPATCSGGASVYNGYGQGQGCRTSEYASNRSWINGTNGYIKIVKIGD